MKRKVLFGLILAALMLSACKTERPSVSESVISEVSISSIEEEVVESPASTEPENDIDDGVMPGDNTNATELTVQTVLGWNDYNTETPSGIGVLRGNYRLNTVYRDASGSNFYEEYVFNEIEDTDPLNHMGTMMGVWTDSYHNKVLFFLGNDYRYDYKIVYDGRGHIMSISDDYGMKFEYTYNDNGQITQAIDSAGYVYNYEYKGTITITCNADGDVLVYYFDNNDDFAGYERTGRYDCSMVINRDKNGKIIGVVEKDPHQIYTRNTDESYCTFTINHLDVDGDDETDDVVLTCVHEMYEAQVKGEMCGTDSVDATLTIKDSSVLIRSDAYAGEIVPIYMDQGFIFAVNTMNQEGKEVARLFAYKDGETEDCGSVEGFIQSNSGGQQIITKGFEFGQYTGETIVYVLNAEGIAEEVDRFTE